MKSMAANQMKHVIKSLRTAVLRDGAGMTDGELLEFFVRHRDDAALAALVRRHGQMVWGVCRRILSHHQDAEDAFQATFLVFVRKAAAIQQKQLVANWLHGVAQHTATKARAVAVRRSGRERQVLQMPEPAVVDRERWNDLQPLMDQELSSLPEKYRILLVLCDLEGRTRKEAAQQLGCPEGTVAGRLARARTMLARRLARRGLAISGGALATLLSASAASADVRACVVSATITAASGLAAGQAVTRLVSPSVAALTEGVLKGMLYGKLKAATVLLLSLVTCTCMVLAAGQTASKQPQDNPKAERSGAERSGPEKSGEQGIDAWWSDLASTADATASRALLAFSSKPNESTAFFKERLKPVKADPGQIKKLVAQLDDQRFAVREAASRELEYLGKFAKPVLDECLKGTVSLETKKRIERALAQLPAENKQQANQPNPLAAPQGNSVSVSNVNGKVQIMIDGQPFDLEALTKPAPPAVPPRPNTQWLRAVRSVTLLERFATPQARALLEALATGEEEAPPTQEAKAALKRLAK
jgi:RNA polymerase sigma factor (sigma-70 family)